MLYSLIHWKNVNGHNVIASLEVVFILLAEYIALFFPDDKMERVQWTN